MALLEVATKVHMDSSSDDPSQARVELADLVDKFNALLTHLANTPSSVYGDIGSDGVKVQGSLGFTCSRTETGTYSVILTLGYQPSNASHSILTNTYGSTSATSKVTITSEASGKLMGFFIRTSDSTTGAAMDCGFYFAVMGTF